MFDKARSIKSFLLLLNKLQENEGKDQVFDVFYRSGERLRIVAEVERVRPLKLVKKDDDESA